MSKTSQKSKKRESKKTASSQSTVDALRALCHRATMILTCDMTQAVKSAPATRPQMTALLDFLKRRDIQKFIAPASEKQLRAYVASEISVSQLPPKTREALNAAAVYSKPWPKKTAAMLLAVHEQRRAASRKSKRNAKKSAATTENQQS